MRRVVIYECVRGRQDDKGVYIGVIARMFDALDAGEQPVIHGDGSQSYDCLDVRDCARANILAMQPETTCRSYNVGAGIQTSIAEPAERLIEIHPNKLAARFELGSRPFVQNRVGATERASKEIGFRAAIELDCGLRELMWRVDHK